MPKINYAQGAGSAEEDTEREGYDVQGSGKGLQQFSKSHRADNEAE